MVKLPFTDRVAAGRGLADSLARLQLTDALVCGVPRGGVPVAAEVSSALGAELDVVVVRKVGAPGNPELGLGAVGAFGDPILDRRLLERLRVSESFLSQEVATQREEARRRVLTYRGDRPPPLVEGRDVVVIDDGIATGGTVVAAGELLRTQGPARLILAVPVAPREGLERVGRAFDEVVCLATPEPYFAVGQWYEDFHQVTDAEVRALLGTDRV